MSGFKSLLGAVVNFSIPSFGTGFTIHFLINQDWVLATISFIGTVFVSFFTIFRKYLQKLIKKLLEKLEKKLDTHVDSLAEWIIGQLESWTVKQWWRVSSNFQGKYYQHLANRCRDYQTEGTKTKGPFILSLNKVYVSLRIRPEDPGKISQKMLQQSQENVDSSLNIWNFLIKKRSSNIIYHQFRRLAIIGVPGSGKTTLLKHLALTYAEQSQERGMYKLIPMLIYLRDIGEKESFETLDLPSFLIKNNEIQYLKPSPDWFEDKLERGKCLVLLDGLDEVASQQKRQAVCLWIDKQITKYPRSWFIVTSRPLGFTSANLKNIGAVLEVQSFNILQISKFINNWYLQHEIMKEVGKDDPITRTLAAKRAKDLLQRIRADSAIASMSVNPLLLTMIASVHDNRGMLPERRVNLYSEICDVLLGRRQEAKGIKDSLNSLQRQSILQVLSLALMKKRTSSFTFEESKYIIQHELRQFTSQKAEPMQFLNQTKNICGLLVEREQGLYAFVHKSFQEYLAAVQIKKTNMIRLLVDNMSDPWWSEVIHLYTSMEDADSTELVDAALSDGSIDSLTLVYDCLDEGSMEASVREKLEARLIQDLRSKNQSTFNFAAEVYLSRQLKNLIRIDDATFIGSRSITCVEYQLFLNEYAQNNIFYYPDDWHENHFHEYSVDKAITGVRASDAKLFCDWLSLRYQSQGYKFRLPSIDEIRGILVDEEFIGCWCLNSDSKATSGNESNFLCLNSLAMKALEEQVVSLLEDQLSIDLATDYTKILPINLINNLNDDHKNNQSLQLENPIQTHLIFRGLIHLDFDHLTSAITHSNTKLDSALNINLDLERAVEISKNRKRDRERDKHLDFRILGYYEPILVADIRAKRNRREMPFDDFSDTGLHAIKQSKELLARLKAIQVERLGMPISDIQMTLVKRENKAKSIDTLNQSRRIILQTIIWWDQLIYIYSSILDNRILMKLNNIERSKCLTLISEYSTIKVDLITVWGLVSIMKFRKERKISAWEGFRVVRERVS